MELEDLFENNLQAWARFSPSEAVMLPYVDCKHLQQCVTNKGELNLYETSETEPFCIYSQEGALIEATKWAQSLSLKDQQVVLIYGLGLGYYYLPLKKWLEQSADRHVIFIEDDPRVVYYFMNTQLASEILNHSQVTIKLLTFSPDQQEKWENIEEELKQVMYPHLKKHVHISALFAYFITRFSVYNFIYDHWLQVQKIKMQNLDKFFSSKDSFINYYANLPWIYEAVLAEKIFGEFQSIPAILCGAGPSLSKQLPFLKQLREKAVIFASGSAITPVTRSGIIPHGVGAVDIAATQTSRLFTSFANDIPAFYRNRFNSTTFSQWHGPKLFVSGSGVFLIGEWFEKQLGLSPYLLWGGLSTSNYLLNVLGSLKCNPIILIGMDLAYTNEQRYTKEIAVHPVDSEIEFQKTQTIESKVPMPSANGSVVNSNPFWINEAIHMVTFQHLNPDILLLNATEGGMEIKPLPHLSFKQAIATFLNESWDIRGWMHGLIQNAAKYSIQPSTVMPVIERWKESLERSSGYLSALQEDLTFNQERLQKGEKLRYGLYSGRAALWEVLLAEEPAFQYLLFTYQKLYKFLHLLDLQKLKYLPQSDIQTLTFEIESTEYLKKIADQHINFVGRGINTFKHVHEAFENRPEHVEAFKEKVLPPEYRKEDKTIEIIEPELGLNLKFPFNPPLIDLDNIPKPGQNEFLEALIGEKEGKREGQSLNFYPNGALKVEAFYYRGELHGPSTFYSDQGTLLVRSWYLHGRVEGKCCFYYATGELYSLQCYKGGFPHHKHLYYYLDGTLKTEENYVDGELDGIVRLYYPNGRLKKEQHFFQGTLNGKENMWDEEGRLIIETLYEQNRPVGISRRWYPNGQLEREIIHGDSPEHDVRSEWDEKGMLKNG